MLALLSPAKKLQVLPKPYDGETTTPILIKDALVLAKIMKTKSAEELTKLMSISKDLAALNYERFQSFDLKETQDGFTAPALYLFQGDVYQNLKANTWSSSEVEYAQSHLGILSGLYGILRPLDNIQPYRLEMGVALKNPKGNHLYAYWTELVTHTLNTLLKSHTNPVLINLASLEYAKVIDAKRLNYPMVTVQFYEKKHNELKTIGILAKKARGMMAKCMMCKHQDTVDELKSFEESGYRYRAELSDEQTLTYVREST